MSSIREPTIRSREAQMATYAQTATVADELVGRSLAMEELRQNACRLAGHDVNVLLQGETGTGKEITARFIHSSSQRCGAPFVGVNCAAIHESLLESELFGHEEGAFTGARHATLGFLRAAEGGTILLDEVGDMSPSLQSKLLRVLEERAVVPVGGTRAVLIDVRVISATHLDLAQAVQQGIFREDLYYRLNVVCLSIPPLRERLCDIPLLAEHMLGQIAADLQVPQKTLSCAALEVMMRYDWPGNVRELGNVIQRAYVLGRWPTVEVEDLPPKLRGHMAPTASSFPTLQETIGRHVQKALGLSGGVRKKTAQLLAVDPKTLRRLIARHNLT
jgi:DNA-binding NtrC family response regulator